MLPVIEIFGPTLQGEGQRIGCKTMFVRLAGCDYGCTWCDSAYTWRADVLARAEAMTAEEICGRLRSLDPSCREVTISGGNPALHDCGALVALLGQEGYLRHVETQGSRPSPWLRAVDSVTISPKPPSSGMDTDWGLLRQTVAVSARPDLKVVVFDQNDYDYAQEVHRRHPGLPFTLQVGNNVGTDDTAALLERLRWMAERALSDPGMQGARVLPQMHVLLWGNKRGV